MLIMFRSRKLFFQVLARANLEFETENSKIGDVQCPVI